MKYLPLLQHTIIVLYLLLLYHTTIAAPLPNYPFFNNCNPSWGSKIMGSSNKTICEAGSMLSCIASGLCAMSIKIKGV